MQVSTQPTSICIELKFTISALAVTLKTLLGATVNANGSLQGTDLYNSMYQSQGTTSSAIANYPQILHSAMELINSCSDGV